MQSVKIPSGGGVTDLVWVSNAQGKLGFIVSSVDGTLETYVFESEKVIHLCNYLLNVS